MAEAYVYKQGRYTVAQRDALFDRVSDYPDAADGSNGQVPTKTANGIEWANLSGGGVTSFNSRTGTVLPASGDYTPAQVGATAVSNIAKILGDNTAGQNVAVGEYCIYNDTLYKATAAIASTDTAPYTGKISAVNGGGLNQLCIKTYRFSGTTASNGILLLTDVFKNGTALIYVQPDAGSFDGIYSPFYSAYSNGYYGIVVGNINDHTPASNKNISGVVYYIGELNT